MNATLGRLLRIAAELLVVALVIGALVTGSLYALAFPDIEHPVRGESAWRTFVLASIVLSGLSTIAAWILWLALRRRAAVDKQPDVAARFLALAVAVLPEHRRDWGEAMTAELSSLNGRRSRWSFAVSGARAALLSPPGARRPAVGWEGAALGVVGVLACVAGAAYMLAVHPKETVAATSPFLLAVLVVVLAVCLALVLAAPQMLMSSDLARRVGLWLGVAAGVGLLVASRSGALDAGAMTYIVPVEFLALVVAPGVVAAVARSLGAAVQTILWSFVFGTVTMFPVYVFESLRRFRADGGLYLDGDADVWTTIGTNFADAVSWLLVVVPTVLIPLGILGGALAAGVARTIEPPAATRR